MKRSQSVGVSCYDGLSITVVAEPHRYVSVQPFRRALARLNELLDDINFDLRGSAFGHSQRFGR